MAAPHPGKWEIVLEDFQCIDPDPEKVRRSVLDTEKTAMHALIIYNPAPVRKWKVLYFIAGSRDSSGYVTSRIWDPSPPQGVSPISSQLIPNWDNDPSTEAPALLCCGHSRLADEKILFAGGIRPFPPPPKPPIARGLWYTYIFNPVNEQWSIPGPTGNPHAMADGRFYPTLTTLGTKPDGQLSNQVIAMSGRRKDLVGGNPVVNKDPEIYHPNVGWRFMRNQTVPQPDAQQPFDDLYTGAHLIPFGSNAGKIFYSMPMTQAQIFNPFFDGPPNGGFWTAVGQNRSTYRYAGNSVLLPLLPSSTSAKVLILGGGNEPNGGQSGSNSAEIIDISSGFTWEPANPMFFARRNSNAVILPDDTILVVGGNNKDEHDEPVYTAEKFDPATGDWTLLPAMNIYRTYHSVAILLPDGRVWASGTTHPGQVAENWQNNIEIHSPGYLFEGTRPEILSAPDNITYGSLFGIDVSLPITGIRLIRLGSVTHATDMDQRSVGLTFTPGQPNGTNPYTVNAPANANIAPPGYYMLFALRDKQYSLSGQTMIPSVAKIVKLGS